MSIKIRVADHILFEDAHILVVDKPASLMVEPDRNNFPNLLDQVRQYVRQSSRNKDAYVQHLHRLDRPVSGIVLFTKDRTVLHHLSNQFAERRVRKYYQALTDQAPANDAGTLENWLRKEKKQAVLYPDQITGAEKAILHYTTLRLPDGKTLWNIELHTGKFHQIRAQLASVGCPIVGDVLYGSTTLYKPDAIALHASKLVFTHPVESREIVIDNPGKWF